MSTRVERVSEEVRAAIAGALLTEVSDPSLQLVSVNAVHMSADLSFAKVYWTPVAAAHDEKELARIARAFDRAKGFLRRHVGKTVRSRVTPELAFVYDESLERGRRMDELLSELDVPSADGDTE